MRRKKKQQNHTNESWLLPYADMLTLLLALFIVLYASSEIDEKKFFDLRDVFSEQLSTSTTIGIIEGGEGIQPQTSENAVDLSKQEEQDADEEVVGEDDEQPHFNEVQYQEFLEIQNDIHAYITEFELEERISTELTDEGLLLTIVNDVLFDSGSAQVKEESHETAREISNLLSTDPPHQIIVSGHADDVPVGTSVYDSNWELSVARALNFMKLILENNELDPTLFSAKGFGEYNPLFPNDSAENRAKNRRVEVLILPTVDLNQGEE